MLKFRKIDGTKPLEVSSGVLLIHTVLFYMTFIVFCNIHWLLTTGISIWQNRRNRENQKATAPTKVRLIYYNVYLIGLQ